MDHYGNRVPGGQGERPGWDAIWPIQNRNGGVPEPIADSEAGRAPGRCRASMPRVIENPAMSGGLWTTRMAAWAVPHGLPDRPEGTSTVSGHLPGRWPRAERPLRDRRALGADPLNGPAALPLVIGSLPGGRAPIGKMLNVSEADRGGISSPRAPGWAVLRERQGRHGEALTSYRQARHPVPSAGSRLARRHPEQLGWSEASLGNYQRTLAAFWSEAWTAPLTRRQAKRSPVLGQQRIRARPSSPASRSDRSYRQALAPRQQLGARCRGRDPPSTRRRDRPTPAPPQRPTHGAIPGI